MSQVGFISAVLHKLSTTEESFKRFEVPPSPVDSDKKVSVKTGTRMEFGYRDEEKDSFIVAKIHFKVTVVNSSSHTLGEYSCVVSGEFKISHKHGFSDWEDMAKEVPVPYFSFVHYIARERAKESFVAAGVGHLNIPIPDELDGHADRLQIAD